jgi:hypothetical protein
VAGVGLDPDEVVAPGRLQVRVLPAGAVLGQGRLPAREGLAVGHGQGQADGHAGRLLDRRRGLGVGGHEHLVGPPAPAGVALPGREPALEVAGRRHHVGFVQGAGLGHGVAQVAGRPGAEAGEAVRGGRLRPAAGRGHPAGGGEVVEGDHRLQAELPAAGAHGQVVVEGHGGELALLGLDPAPLQREPVAPEAQVGQQAQVLGPAVPVVAGVPARLGAARARGVLPGPPVVVPVAPSTWWAAVAVPHTNPSGKARSAGVMGCSWLDVGARQSARS